jgi:hypothetical protein
LAVSFAHPLTAEQGKVEEAEREMTAMEALESEKAEKEV